MASLIDFIGNTPLLDFRSVTQGVSARIRAKAEHMNPGGSIKDRIAAYILKKAIDDGRLKKDSTILEVSSGNTGIAFSMLGVTLGYKVKIMLPKSVTIERRNLIACYGAEVHLLESLLRMHEAIALTEKLAKDDPKFFLPRQFSNPNNPRCHYETTGAEILKQHPERIDAFVMGVGTGGTLMGVGKRLKEAYPNVLVVGVEPTESAVMSGGPPGCHGIQGFADGFVPDLVNIDNIDQVITVSTQESIAMARRLSREEGYLVGISSGANMYASLKLAKELGNTANIVTILPDRGERYFSVWGG
ncbi:cysteine synthase family protein [Bdellovibrionota bacterium FG-2]